MNKSVEELRRLRAIVEATCFTNESLSSDTGGKRWKKKVIASRGTNEDIEECQLMQMSEINLVNIVRAHQRAFLRFRFPNVKKQRWKKARKNSNSASWGLSLIEVLKSTLNFFIPKFDFSMPKYDLKMPQTRPLLNAFDFFVPKFDFSMPKFDFSTPNFNFFAPIGRLLGKLFDFLTPKF